MYAHMFRASHILCLGNQEGPAHSYDSENTVHRREIIVSFHICAVQMFIG